MASEDGWGRFRSGDTTVFLVDCLPSVSLPEVWWDNDEPAVIGVQRGCGCKPCVVVCLATQFATASKDTTSHAAVGASGTVRVHPLLRNLHFVESVVCLLATNRQRALAL